jgi:tetraacyldisaccharide 4'-kinase
LPTSSPSASSLEATLTRAWQRRGVLASLLFPVSLLFRAITGARAAMYRAGWLASTRLPVPVVIVGNIFIGGTGKTPLTIWLVNALRQAGMRPGVISRGHGGEASSAADGRLPLAVRVTSRAADVGDEPLLIAQSAACPVFVGRDRVAAAQALLAAHPEIDVLVSDDGLQHYRLQRDVEIILFDGRGTGNGWLLPAGPLREPASRRRDVTVVNVPELSAALKEQVGGKPIQMVLAGQHAERLTDRSERISLADLAKLSKRITAAAGIGNPGRFFAMLGAAGLKFDAMPLPDHHDFVPNPFEAIAADVILITEKDAVKCAQLENLNNDPRLWVVPVAAQLDAALAADIVEKCRGRKVT